MDVLKQRCKTCNNIHPVRTTCPQCVEQARAKTVAKAGPPSCIAATQAQRRLYGADPLYDQFYKSRLPAAETAPPAEIASLFRPGDSYIGVDWGLNSQANQALNNSQDALLRQNAQQMLADLQPEPMTPANKWQKLENTMRTWDAWVNAGFVRHEDGERMKDAAKRDMGIPVRSR